MLDALPNWIQDRLLGLLPLHTLTLVAHAAERWTEKVEMHASEPDMWRRVNATVAEVSRYVIELTITSVTMVTVTDLVEIVSEGVLAKLCIPQRAREDPRIAPILGRSGSLAKLFDRMIAFADDREAYLEGVSGTIQSRRHEYLEDHSLDIDEVIRNIVGIQLDHHLMALCIRALPAALVKRVHRFMDRGSEAD